MWCCCKGCTASGNKRSCNWRSGNGKWGAVVVLKCSGFGTGNLCLVDKAMIVYQWCNLIVDAVVLVRLVMTRLGVAKMLGKGGPGLVSEVVRVFGTCGEVCWEFCCSKWSLVEEGGDENNWTCYTN